MVANINNEHVRLSAECRVNLFLAVYVAFYDAPNRSNTCSSYASVFFIDGIQIIKCDNGPVQLRILTGSKPFLVSLQVNEAFVLPLN